MARTERRFEPIAGGRARLAAGVGAVGAALLGAGTYAQWIRETPLEQGALILGAGAVLFGVATWLAGTEPAPLRVGAGGVAREREGGDPERIAWCDVARVVLERGRLVVSAHDGRRVEVPLAEHAQAAAWVVREASARVPATLENAEGTRAAVGAPAGSAGTEVPLAPPQVAGRRCKASGKLVTFESDARVCERCGQVYHRDAVPERCVTCEGAMAGGDDVGA